MAGIVATKNGGSDFEIVPAESHVARICKIVHIGTVLKPGYMGGAPSKKNQVRLVWELPLLEIKQEDTTKPKAVMSIGKEYLLSTGSKSNLRADIDSWRKTPLTEEQAEEYDITELLGDSKRPGAACLLGVKHVDGSGKNKGKTFANVGTVLKLPNGLTCPPPVNAVICFSHAEPDDKKFVDAFASLTKYEQKLVQDSDEWKARLPKISGMVATIVGQESAAAPGVAADDDEDNPF